MNVGEALMTRLLAMTAVTDLVGDRIFYGVREQGSGFPALVITVIGQEDEETLDGPVDPARSTVQLDAYATTHLAAWTLALAVKDGLREPDEVGTFLFWPAEDVRGPRDFSSLEETSDRLHRASIDMTLRHSIAA